MTPEAKTLLLEVLELDFPRVDAEDHAGNASRMVTDFSVDCDAAAAAEIMALSTLTETALVSQDYTTSVVTHDCEERETIHRVHVERYAALHPVECRYTDGCLTMDALVRHTWRYIVEE